MSDHVKEVSDSSFETEVLKSDQPVLVDFWAAWCAPCRMLAPTVEAVAEKYAGNDSHAKLDAMLSALVGASDETRRVDHSEELLAASRKAREQLPKLRALFNAGLKPGESILVKAPFRMDDDKGDEWMWVEVTHWDGGSIRGLLMNDPAHVRSLHVGQAVDVDEAKVFDYIHKLPDGRREGNMTGAVIEKTSR